MVMIQQDLNKMLDALIYLENTITTDLNKQNEQIKELERLIKIWVDEYKRFDESR